VFPTDLNKNQLILEKLAQISAGALQSSAQMHDMFCINIHPEYLLPVFEMLRNDSDLQYNFLTSLCGMHYPETKELGVVYHLHSFSFNNRLRIKLRVPENKPVIASLTGLWPAANWMERETYDFFGIIFDGHPNLKRILNVDEMQHFPLRKDFPLEDQTREDKDDSMFGR
jgi:NADH-quinone oxidoreductase subunit C